MFTQFHQMPHEERLPEMRCDGCPRACYIYAIRDTDGIIYPQIQTKTIKYYVDAEGKVQLIFPYTCPTFQAGQRLASQIATLCDNYKQKCR